MPIAPPRELKIGMIVEQTLGVIERCARPIVIFVLALTVINGITDYYTAGSTAITQNLAKSGITFVVGVVASFHLLSAMMHRTGQIAKPTDDAFLPYCGLAILQTLGTLAGFLLLILPGLFFMARWIVAQQILIARGGRPVESLKESWERTRGSEFPILVALLVLVIALIAVSGLARYFYDPTDPVGIGISQLASSAMSAVSLSMGVAIYQQVVVDRDKVDAATPDLRNSA